MIRPLIIFFLIILLNSCNNQPKNIKINNPIKSQANDTTYKGLHGTWIRHNKAGFTLIEIKDTTNVLYYRFFDRKTDIDTIKNDRYWYYKSKAKMGYWNSNNSAIWILTDKFRFDYKVKNDTLIEFDKMEDQGKLIKVKNDNGSSE